MTCHVRQPRIVETILFKGAFGPKAQRKCPRPDVWDFKELIRVGGASQGMVFPGEFHRSEWQQNLTRKSSQSLPLPMDKLIQDLGRFVWEGFHSIITTSFTRLPTLDIVLHVPDTRDFVHPPFPGTEPSSLNSFLGSSHQISHISIPYYYFSRLSEPQLRPDAYLFSSIRLHSFRATLTPRAPRKLDCMKLFKRYATPPTITPLSNERSPSQASHPPPLCPGLC